MTTLAAEEARHVHHDDRGAVQCTQAITEAAQNGMKETAKYLFMPSVCKAPRFVSKEKVGGDGVAVERLVDRRRRARRTSTPRHSPTTPTSVWARKLLADNGLDSEDVEPASAGFYSAGPGRRR